MRYQLLIDDNPAQLNFSDAIISLMVKRSLILNIISFFAFLLVGILLFSLGRPVSDPGPIAPSPDSPKDIVIEGEHVCLPHRNTKGPQTLECAFGIKTGDFYYSLDFGGNWDLISGLGTNRRIRVEGLLVPVNEIDNSHWNRYNIQGIIKVRSIKAI